MSSKQDDRGQSMSEQRDPSHMLELARQEIAILRHERDMLRALVLRGVQQRSLRAAFLAAFEVLGLGALAALGMIGVSVWVGRPFYGMFFGLGWSLGVGAHYFAWLRRFKRSEVPELPITHPPKA